MYVMSHNATGYEEDMNPDMIDGIHDGRDQWAQRNVELALRAEAIVKRLDPDRIVYHHASGNLGVMHDSNFYPNFAPIQELSDWFEHWATEGVKPVFTCEYGAPFTWDWTMYRGWYKGQREWGSAKVPWEFCLAEWNAQFLGDRAYRISEAEKAQPPLGSQAVSRRQGLASLGLSEPGRLGPLRRTLSESSPCTLTDNWRAYRTWGVSGISPWEYGHFWKLRQGVDRSRKELPVDWDNLQRPGFSPDYLEQRYERMDMAFDRADWIATPAAEALVRNNRPLLAYIAGKPDAFTSKDHNFQPGDTIEKQIIIINNSRESVTCDARWSLEIPHPIIGQLEMTVAAGDQARIPVRFPLPKGLPSGSYDLKLTAKLGRGEVQEDRFVIDVMPESAPSPGLDSKIAVFDPKGETSKFLNSLGFRATPVSADADLSSYDLLIIGKAALTVDGATPALSRVRAGLKVIVFEQTSDVLEKRLGFRVTEYGLRRVFPRVSDHPALAGIRPENLHDWCGSATIVSARLKYEMRSRYGPTVEWAGLPVTRVWRCGNRGNVASVLIEKPARGDFLPIVDGGFSLQYSPLMEFREGKGMALFCQLDVTGRTGLDPAAEKLVQNMMRYVAAWKPTPRRTATYAGEPAGKSWLESAGVSVRSYEGGGLTENEVLVLGPGCGKLLAKAATDISHFLKGGGNLLAIGLNPDDLSAPLPFQTTLTKAEHIASFFEPFGVNSLLAGIGPADIHNRAPRELFLVSSGAEVVGDGVLAKVGNANVVFLQMPPWQFQNDQQMNLRRTFRRTSATLGRLLANMGIAGSTPLLERFNQPTAIGNSDPRWREGFYLDQPQEWDDPYRFFRW